MTENGSCKMEEDILLAKRKYLLSVINDLFNDSALHSRVFVWRILGSAYTAEISHLDITNEISDEEIHYGGNPEIASLGYIISSKAAISSEESSAFMRGINRLMQRSQRALETLQGDDVAILGLADGLSKLSQIEDSQSFVNVKEWLIKIIDSSTEMNSLWSHRLRQLAGDLLDSRGRLRASPAQDNINTRSLEVSLRYVWPEQFELNPPLSWEEYRQLLEDLLLNSEDKIDIEKVAIWLRTIDILVKEATVHLFPKNETETLAISQLTTIKNELDRKAEKKWRIFKWLYFLTLLVAFGAMALAYIFAWDVMEPWTEIFNLLVVLFHVLYFVITQQTPSLQAISERMIAKNRKVAYQKVGLDQKVVEHLVP